MEFNNACKTGQAQGAIRMPDTNIIILGAFGCADVHIYDLSCMTKDKDYIKNFEKYKQTKYGYNCYSHNDWLPFEYPPDYVPVNHSLKWHVEKYTKELKKENK